MDHRRLTQNAVKDEDAAMPASHLWDDLFAFSSLLGFALLIACVVAALWFYASGL